jgi:hypothetical protein
LASTAVLFIVSGSVFGQSAPQTITREQALKEASKALSRNARYQNQDVTMTFKALDFKTCKVSYTFEQVSSLGNENFGRASVDSNSAAGSAVNNSSTTRQTVSSVTGNSAGNLSNNDPTFSNREATFFNTKRTTSFDLADIDANSITVVTNPKGVFLSFRTLEGRRTIVRNTKGNGAVPDATSGEVLPIVSEKKAAIVKESLSNAINACRQ